MRSPLRRLLLLLATLALPVLVAIHAPLSLLAANKTEVLASEALRSDREQNKERSAEAAMEMLLASLANG